MTSITAEAPPRLTVSELIQRAAFTTLDRIPKVVLRQLIPPVVNADGDVMAPEIALLMRFAAAAPDFSDCGVAEARAIIETDSRVFADTSETADADSGIVLPSGIRASLYRPKTQSNGLVLFLHGGGFVLGSRTAYDSPARLIAAHAGVNVLSIEYRLAPEALPRRARGCLGSMAIRSRPQLRLGHRPGPYRAARRQCRRKPVRSALEPTPR